MLHVAPKHLCDVELLELLFPPPPIIRGTKDFRGYQHWMSNTIMAEPAVFLAAGMGLGKTAASLWAAVRLLKKGRVKCVLIVAPLRVAENTWPEEIAAWDFARSLEYTVVTGDEEQRKAALAIGGNVHIINRENVVWLQKYWGRKWPYDMLIYDEASRLKAGSKKTKPVKRKDGSKGPKRTSEFGILSRMRGFFKKVVLLSGTPSPNGLIDLWGPMFIIDHGARLGTSITEYKRRWFSEDRWSHRIEPFEHSRDQIMSAISDVFYSLKEEDYLELPPLVTRDHKVRLDPKHMQMYRRFERTKVLAEYDIEAVNSGVLTNKLLQFANGSMYLTDQSAQHIHDAKLDVLESIMEESFGQPVLVAYSFKFDMDRIKKRFPYVRIFGESKSDNRDWNTGRIRMMLTHPASAGHGLNFQHGGNIAVWYGLTWSLELYQQFLKRLHRSGQLAAEVLMHRILAQDTVDYDVLRVLDKKGATQDDITDAVRVRMESLEPWRMAA